MVDFLAKGLARPHIMRFGSIDFYRGRVASVNPDTYVERAP